MGERGKEVRSETGRRVLDYGPGHRPAPFPWWAFIGPVSLVGLWLRVFGVLPFPYGGMSWHRCEGTILAWLFLTNAVPALCCIVENKRLGKRFDWSEWVALTFFANWVLTWMTGVALIVAVAYAHGK